MMDIAKQIIDQKVLLYEKAETVLAEVQKEYFNTDALEGIDGRTMAAAFRRFDIVERYLKNESWWHSHMQETL